MFSFKKKVCFTKTLSDDLLSLSKDIYSLKTKTNKNSYNYLAKNNYKFIIIYQKNYFQTISAKILEVFVVLSVYLDSNQFNYLISKFIRSGKINSLDQFIICTKFLQMILLNQKQLADDFICQLAKLDYCNTFCLKLIANYKIKIYSGMLDLWSSCYERYKLVFNIINKNCRLESTEKKCIKSILSITDIINVNLINNQTAGEKLAYNYTKIICEVTCGIDKLDNFIFNSGEECCGGVELIRSLSDNKISIKINCNEWQKYSVQKINKDDFGFVLNNDNYNDKK